MKENLPRGVIPKPSYEEGVKFCIIQEATGGFVVITPDGFYPGGAVANDITDVVMLITEYFKECKPCKKKVKSKKAKE